MYIYAWAFIKLTVRGNHQVPKLFVLFKTITKVGKAHKAPNSGQCTGALIFTLTTIVEY